MKKHNTYFMLISYFLVVAFSFAQEDSKIDSLKKLVISEKGTHKIDALNELAWIYKKELDSTGIHYALEALQLGEKENYVNGISDAYSRLGIIARNQKQPNLAKEYYTKALHVSEKHNYLHGIGRAKNQLARIYKKEKKYQKALEYFLFSLDVFIQEKEYVNAYKVSKNIGELYFNNDKYIQALTYYQRQLDYSHLVNDSVLIARAYQNIGDVQKKIENYDQALDNFKKAEKIYKAKNKTRYIADVMIEIASIYDYLNQDKLAKKTFTNALKLIDKYQKGDKGALHLNFGVLYRKLGQIDSASYHYQKAEAVFKQKNDKERLLTYYNNLGNTYADYQEYDKALSSLKQSLMLQTFVKDSSMLEKTYLSLSKVYAKQDNYQKALRYKDSAFTLQKIKYLKIKDTDQFLVTSANEKIELINIRNKQEQESKDRKAIIIGSVITIMFLIGLFFYVTQARRQKQKRILAEADLKQQKLIVAHEKQKQEQKIQDLLKTQEMNAINAMISGQEEERKRIAQDLHDNLGSKLSLVKIHYQSVEDNFEHIDNDAKLQYEKANQLLDEACKSVREISHNMISGTLSKFGLIPALKELKQTLESVFSTQHQHQIEIEISHHKLESRLENTMEIQIYRIIQELLNNIIKHAEATQVTIQLLKLEQGINIIVEDNGVGFDITKKRTGIGLKTIESRVISMNGNCLIDSGKGNGTTITIDIPT